MWRPWEEKTPEHSSGSSSSPGLAENQTNHNSVSAEKPSPLPPQLPHFMLPFFRFLSVPSLTSGLYWWPGLKQNCFVDPSPSLSDGKCPCPILSRFCVAADGSPQGQHRPPQAPSPLSAETIQGLKTPTTTR